MSFPILGSPKPQFSNSSGSPYAAGTLSVLEPTTDANKTYYPTADDADAGTNGASGDITLDSRGEPTNALFGIDDQKYKLVLKDSAAATIWTVDDVRLPTRIPTLYGKTAQTLTDAGAVTVTESTTFLVTTGAAAITLADGVENQHKLIVMKTDAGAATLTPTNLSNGITIVFDDVGDSADLWFVDGSWCLMGGTAKLPNTAAATTFTTGDATPSISGSDTWILDGSTTITDFDDGNIGDIIHIKAGGGSQDLIIAHSSAVLLAGAIDFHMSRTDALTLGMFTDQVWSEIGRTITNRGPLFLTADLALINTTLADVTELSTLSLTKDTYYVIEGYLKVISDGNTQDLKIALQTSSAFQEAHWSYTNVNDAGTLVGDADTPTTAMIVDIVTGTVHGVSIKGYVLTDSGTISAVDFQAAQGTDAGTTTIEKGSWFNARAIE